MSRAALLLVPVLMISIQARATMAECSAAEGAVPAISGVQIEEALSGDPDMQMLRITARRGSFMHVYFDAGSEAVARQYAACLGTQLNLLSTELLDEREGVQWDSVVFSNRADYTPASAAGIKRRWVISTDPSAFQGVAPRPMVLETMPHEQVHEYQGRNGAELPLWFSEGHASWAGLKITSMLDPATSKSNRDKTLNDADLDSVPADLAGWGNRRPKREAMMRQVSPEDRAKMEADPTYIPNVTFQFTLDDFESDESKTLERYAASLLVFEALEARHGADEVRRWVAEITSGSDVVSETMLATSIKAHFGADMAELLAD